jgi:predicted ATPase/DNA-binding CsgD family transcriptional regulator
MTDRVGQQLGNYPSTRSEARPSTPRAEPMWRVPTSFRPLLGREQDVVAICALLSRPEARLVTLVGTGGVGKTRLSLEVATRMRDAFADGVCFVGLAAISDPDLVLPTIAYELGVQEGGVQSLPEQVKVALQDKHLLLILDNFEQVARAALQVADLLAACPRLKILVTSRVVLHTQAEYEFPLPPLALPPLTRLPEGEALAQYAAVALFLERARALKPNFQLTPANARAIAEICVRLDGLPLAIELAAAWIKLLPPQALLARLEHRLEILTSRARDVPIRQQTLRNTLIWSYDLLDAQEQWLFRQLSVFVGGCTLEATEAVCNTLGNIAVNVLGTLASLIDKNLLQQLEQANGVPRLQMMATIREYGLECLAAHGETEVVRRAHAEYYLKLAEEVEPKLFGAEQKWWFDRLEQEYENLRAALHWSVERGELEVALRLGGALWRFWLVRGYLSEELVWLEPAIKGIEGVRASVRAKALLSAGALAYHHGDINRAEALCRESLTLFRELGDIQGIAFSLHRLGQVASVRSNYIAARSLEEEALQLFKEVDDKEGIAYSLTDLAYGAIDQGEFMRARLMAEEGLALFRMSGDKRGIVYALLRLGRVYYFSQEDLASAYSLAEEALKISREVGYKWGMASSLGLLGQLILKQGDTIAAYSLLEEALVIRREIGYGWGIAWGLYSLGWVAFDQSDYSVAKALFEECLAILREWEDKEFLASGLEALGAVVSAQGDPIWAVQLWGAAEALREMIGAPIAPASRATYDRLVAEARAQLSEEIFAARWAEGRSMPPEQVLAAQATAEGPLPPPVGPPSTPPVKTSPVYPAGLTARELEVLRLLAKGLTSAQIAEQLVIGLVTVNSHIRSVYSKLGVSSRSAATRYAIEQHLV